jgi:Raf kinase inhibitor-like YbhB/YbcL family protein
MKVRFQNGTIALNFISGDTRVRIHRVRTIGAATILFLAVIGSKVQRVGAQEQPAAAARPRLTLSTTSFEDGGIIPAKYTQLVPHPVSPELKWSYVPENTVSFVLIVHDPDGAAHMNLEDALHWMLFNIPGSVRELPEGAAQGPKFTDGTIQGKNGLGKAEYIGMGAGSAGPYHHYTFELFALDRKLDLGPDAIRADVLKAIDGHILGKAVLVGRFHR